MSILDPEPNVISEEDLEKIRVLEEQIVGLTGKEKAKIYQRIWRIKNKDKDKEYQKKSYQNNLERERARKSKYYHEVDKVKKGRGNKVGRPRKYDSSSSESPSSE